MFFLSLPSLFFLSVSTLHHPVNIYIYFVYFFCFIYFNFFSFVYLVYVMQLCGFLLTQRFLQLRSILSTQVLQAIVNF